MTSMNRSLHIPLSPHFHRACLLLQSGHLGAAAVARVDVGSWSRRGQYFDEVVRLQSHFFHCGHILGRTRHKPSVLLNRCESPETDVDRRVADMAADSGMRNKNLHEICYQTQCSDMNSIKNYNTVYAISNHRMEFPIRQLYRPTYHLLIKIHKAIKAIKANKDSQSVFYKNLSSYATNYTFNHFTKPK